MQETRKNTEERPLSKTINPADEKNTSESVPFRATLHRYRQPGQHLKLSRSMVHLNQIKVGSFSLF